MTIVDERPAAPPPPPPGGTGSPGGGPAPARPRPSGPSSVDSEAVQNIALTMLTVATALCMRRLFSDWSYLGPTVLAAVGAHAAGWGARHRAVPGVLAIAAQLGIGALVISWIIVPESTYYGIPTGATWDTVTRHTGDAFHQFREITAPAPVSSGFVIASVIGVVLVATLADWAAFRMRAPIESVIPAFALFVFTAALGSDHFRPLSIAVELAAILFFLFAYSTGPRTRATAWFASRSRGGLAALARPALVIGAVAVAAALILGPSLPGAGSSSLIAWKNRGTGNGGNSSRTTVSPFVSIRERLVQHSGAAVFMVKSSVRSYWRLTSLDTFDGTVWSSNDSYKSVKRDLSRADFEPAPKNPLTVTQDFVISGLSSIWLPAAFRPVQIKGLGDVSYNAQAGSLISDRETTDGLTYEVTSAIPELNPAVLAAAPVATAADDPELQRYLALPPSISSTVANLAQQLTAGKANAYDKAMALQDYLRSPRFTYDLSAPAGHDNRALERFLFRTRRGYCEQFAGSFAVLARLAGLPTRVAVGFTTGELQPDGFFHVLDDHAHAWPEVFFPNVGWVAFEPTPGRGNPQASTYTNVPEEQDSATGNGSTATTAPPTTTPTTAPTGQTGSTVKRGENDLKTSGRPQGGQGLATGLIVVLVALGLLLLWSGLVPAARWARRRHRRRRAGDDPAAQVLVAWAEANDVLALAGAGRRPAETLDEHASRAASAAHLDEEASHALSTLAQDASTASYAGDALPPAVAERAVMSAEEVQEWIRSRATRAERLRWIVDPRSLWRR